MLTALTPPLLVPQLEAKGRLWPDPSQALKQVLRMSQWGVMTDESKAKDLNELIDAEMQLLRTCANVTSPWRP